MASILHFDIWPSSSSLPIRRPSVHYGSAAVRRFGGLAECDSILDGVANPLPAAKTAFCRVNDMPKQEVNLACGAILSMGEPGVRLPDHVWGEVLDPKFPRMLPKHVPRKRLAQLASEQIASKVADTATEAVALG
jgi:hypothetical protein